MSGPWLIKTAFRLAVCYGIWWVLLMILVGERFERGTPGLNAGWHFMAWCSLLQWLWSRWEKRGDQEVIDREAADQAWRDANPLPPLSDEVWKPPVVSQSKA